MFATNERILLTLNMEQDLSCVLILQAEHYFGLVQFQQFFVPNHTNNQDLCSKRSSRLDGLDHFTLIVVTKSLESSVHLIGWSRCAIKHYRLLMNQHHALGYCELNCSNEKKILDLLDYMVPTRAEFVICACIDY